MKKIIGILVFMAVFSVARAQEAKLWTLQECIQYAVDHNINIQQLKLQKESASIDLNTSQMSRLPNLNASVGQSWNFGRSELDVDSIVKYINQTRSGTSFGLSSSTPIFTGFRITNEIARNKLNLEAAVQSFEKAKEDLALNVASMFLQVLFNKELLKVSQEQLALSRLQVQRTEYLVEAGKVPDSQLYDIKAQVAKDETSVIQAENDLKLATLDLAQGLELEHSVDFDIQSPSSGELTDDLLKSVLPADVIYDHAVAFKPAVKEQEFLLESSRKSLKIAQAGYWPTLNLSLSYGTNYNYIYGLDLNAPFRDQLRERGGESIGLSLNIPIFNRFQVRNQVRTARLDIQNQQLILENTKKALYKDIQTAYLNAVASQKKYVSSTKAVEASEESFKYARERYDIGKSTVFEFNEARNNLILSQSEQIQAKYDYIFRVKILDFYNGVPITL